MGKRKNREARKQHRERAAHAGQRGLPQAALPSRRAGGHLEAQKSGSRARRAGFADGEGSREGLPTAVKVLIGAVLALLIVFALSQLRKGTAVGERASPSTGQSAP